MVRWLVRLIALAKFVTGGQEIAPKIHQHFIPVPLTASLQISLTGGQFIFNLGDFFKKSPSTIRLYFVYNDFKIKYRLTQNGLIWFINDDTGK